MNNRKDILGITKQLMEDVADCLQLSGQHGLGQYDGKVVTVPLEAWRIASSGIVKYQSIAHALLIAIEGLESMQYDSVAREHLARIRSLPLQ